MFVHRSFSGPQDPQMSPILLFTKAWETPMDEDLRPFRDVPNALRTFYEAEHKGHRDIRDEARVRCLQCSAQGAPYLPPFESSCPSQSAMQSKKNIVICKLEALYFSNLVCPKKHNCFKKIANYEPPAIQSWSSSENENSTLSITKEAKIKTRPAFCQFFFKGENKR